MTVTIAALCGARHAAQAGNFIMCADRLISYSSEDAPISGNPSGTKIYDLPCGFYVAIADDISRSHQVVSYLWNEMKDLTPGHGSMVDLIKEKLENTAEYVRLWMRREVLAEYGVSLDEFLHSKKLALRTEIAWEIKNRVLCSELIIAGFGQNDCPVLLYTDCVNIREETNPGFFCAGGSGATAALNWLNLRKQNCFMPIQQTFYHVREAKKFAEISPAVGVDTHIILLRPGKPLVNLKNETPLLAGWMSEMYPRATDAIGQEKAWSDFAAAYDILD